MNYKQAARESGIITCIAVLLGFSYTFVTGKGFFGGFQAAAVVHSGTTQLAPSPINLAEVKKLFDTDGALFVDARHYFDFRRGHIKSAVNIPLSEFESRQKTIAGLPRDKVIVVYCDESECNSSVELAAKLYEGGIGGVRIFFGGWQDWMNNKLPIESNP